MKYFVAMMIAVATLFVGTAQESQAQCNRGGSGFSVSFGGGGWGSPAGFYGRPVGGFGGWGGYGYQPRVAVGYSSFRPVYGGGYSRSYARPVVQHHHHSRNFHSGRRCGGW